MKNFVVAFLGFVTPLLIAGSSFTAEPTKPAGPPVNADTSPKPANGPQTGVTKPDTAKPDTGAKPVTGAKPETGTKTDTAKKPDDKKADQPATAGQAAKPDDKKADKPATAGQASAPDGTKKAVVVKKSPAKKWVKTYHRKRYSYYGRYYKRHYRYAYHPVRYSYYRPRYRHHYYTHHYYPRRHYAYRYRARRYAFHYYRPRHWSSKKHVATTPTKATKAVTPQKAPAPAKDGKSTVTK